MVILLLLIKIITALMLNSEDLQVLKIDALIQNSTNSYPVHFFHDIGQVLTSSSDNMIFKGNSNSNILAFFYILLSHIYDTRAPASQQSSSSGSPSSQLNSGGSKNRQGLHNSSNQSGKDQQTDENFEIKRKLRRIYQLLLSARVGLDQITNLPVNITMALKNASIQRGNSNLYFKRLILQFLNKLREQKEQNSNRQQQSKKQSNVFHIWQRLPICEFLISIFVRSILYTEYEITEALDYGKPISDHTVYTALCDAFLYGSLHIEENHTEIFSGSYIRLLRLKGGPNEKNNQRLFYLVSLPQCRQDATLVKQMPATDTFRLIKKNSDASNQSYSFRQTPKTFAKQKAQESKKKTIEVDKGNPEEELKLEQKRGDTINSLKAERQIEKIKSETNIKLIQEDKALQKCLSDQAIPVSPDRKEPRGQLNGYTSMEILKELNPKVRESMLNTIGYYRKYNY